MNILSFFKCTPSAAIRKSAMQDVANFNEVMELLEQRDGYFLANINLRAALIDIRLYTTSQKSGTAQKVHRMASEALK